MRTIFFNILVLLGLLFGLSFPGGACAINADDLESKVLTARQAFAEMQDLAVVYAAKNEVAGQILTCESYRGEVEATVRSLKIAIDGFPARRNNLQQEVYAQWLMARGELTETDRVLAGLRSRTQQIDEMVLAQAEAKGKRPGPTNRRDILIAYPAAERECRRAFDALKTAVDAASRDGSDALQVIGEAITALNRAGKSDLSLGPPDAFLAAYRQYKRSLESPPSRPKAKSRSRR
jgi:hypothetical protein